MKRNTGALLESILGALMERPEAPKTEDEPKVEEQVVEEQAIDEDKPEAQEADIVAEEPAAEWIGGCPKPDNAEVLRKLTMILSLLTNRRFGLCEIKREVKEIENNMGNGNGDQGGGITTGPFFIRTGQNNAINVIVQNLEEAEIDVEVKLVDLGACPVFVEDNASLENIDSCCTDSAVLTAAAGEWEVLVCPTPATAKVRAFVSVHSGNAVTSAIEYVFRAAEMLPEACDFCDLVIP